MFYFMFTAQYSNQRGNEIVNENNKVKTTDKPKIKQRLDALQQRPDKNLTSKDDKYIFDMASSSRLNRLFDILYAKEKHIEPTLRSLDLVVFEDLIQNKLDALPESFREFSNEIDTYLDVVDQKVRVTPEFVDFLYEQSNYNTFAHPRKNIEKKRITEVSSRLLKTRHVLVQNLAF